MKPHLNNLSRQVFIRNTPVGVVTYSIPARKLGLIEPSGQVVDELNTMEALKGINYPLKCKYVVTGKCNQRCYHCYVESKFSVAGLSTGDAIRVINRVAEAGTLFLEFFGGEVGVRKDFTELLRAAADHDLVLSFFTNGTLLNSKHISEFPPPQQFAGIIISLLAGSEEEHDRLAKLRGAWSKAFDFALRLKSAGYPVSMTVSATTESAPSLPALTSAVEELGLPLRMIFNTYSEVNHHSNKHNFALNEEEFFVLGRSMPELAKRKFSHKPCFGGTVTYAIDSDGYLIGCDHVTDQLGSVLTNRIQDLWRSTVAREFSAYLYERPQRCKACPESLKSYCTYCPATALHAGLPKEKWVDYFCELALRKKSLHHAAQESAQDHSLVQAYQPRRQWGTLPVLNDNSGKGCGGCTEV